MSASLKLSAAVDAFLFSREAIGRSKNTLIGYQGYLGMFVEWAKDPALSKVTPQMIRQFMYYAGKEYFLRRAGVLTNQRLSAGTLATIQRMLASFFKWASTEFDFKNPHNMEKYKSPGKQVQALTEDEVSKLLRAIDEPFIVGRSGSTYEFHSRTRKRDRALVLMLLDTGCRASELSDARITDLEFDSGRLKVTGKGAKTRYTYFGKKAKQALFNYLLSRYPAGKFESSDPLFMNDHLTGALDRNAMRHCLVRLGKRAKITDTVHPHRFRHTMACTLLANGADIFSLQALLGHSSLVMVRHYAKLAQADIEKIYRRASPADNWKI